MELIEGGKGRVDKVLRLYDPLFDDENLDFKVGIAVGWAREDLKRALHRANYEPAEMAQVNRYAPWAALPRFQKMADHFGLCLVGPLNEPPPGKEGDHKLFCFVPKRAFLKTVK
jgi:hypothetical protein